MSIGHHNTSFNLTGDRSIPFTTYAKFLVDTATSLGRSGDKGFFKSQAQTHIAHALEMLYELKRPVTLLGAFELLSDREYSKKRWKTWRTPLKRRDAPPCMPISQTAFSTNPRSNRAASAKPSGTIFNTF